MKIKIDNYTVLPSTFVAGTRGSYGIEEMELSFSREWEGLAVTVSFYPLGREAVSLIYTGEPFYIPAEVMSVAGSSRMVVSGCLGEKTLITAEALLRVLNTSVPADNPALQPTPSMYDQMMSAIEGKAGAAHSHDGIYAPASGRCEGLTVGYAENLLLSSEQGIEGMVCGTPIPEDVAAHEATVEEAEGLMIKQYLTGGNFTSLSGWSANDGTLSLTAEGAEFSSAAYSAARQVKTDVINIAVDKYEYIYREGEYLYGYADTGNVVIPESGVGVLALKGISPGAVRVTVERYEYNTETEEEGELIGTEEYIVNVCKKYEDKADTVVGFSHGVDLVKGHKYYLNAKIKTPVASDEYKLRLDGCGIFEFDVTPSMEMQTVSGITGAVSDSYGRIAVADYRTPWAEVTEQSGIGGNASVISIDNFMRKVVAPCGGEREGTYIFSYESAGDIWTVYANNIQFSEISASELVQSGLSVTGDVSNGAAFTVLYKSPMEFTATTNIYMMGECGVRNITVDINKFVAARGLVAQSGSHYIVYSDGEWRGDLCGVSWTDVEEPEYEATICIDLRISTPALTVKSIQICDLTALGLEDCPKEVLDAVFSDYIKPGRLKFTEIGGIICRDANGENVGDGITFGENYVLYRLPDGTCDRLSVKDGKLYRYIGAYYISGEEEEEDGEKWLTFEDAEENGLYMLENGRVENFEGYELMIDENMHDKMIYYKLAMPEIIDISEPDKLPVVGGGKLYTCLRPNSSGERTVSIPGAWFKIRFLSDLGDTIDRNRIFAEAMCRALGITMEEGEQADTLAEKIRAALSL